MAIFNPLILGYEIASRHGLRPRGCNDEKNRINQRCAMQAFRELAVDVTGVNMISSNELSAKMEPFDSFWEGPQNVDKGYDSFYKFYKYNYLKRMPEDKNARILVISCGPGYFVNMLNKEGYGNVLGIDSFPEKIEQAKRRGLNCEVARAFEFLQQGNEAFDAIFCEQELNHLTKQEMLVFLDLCWKKLSEGGQLVTHGLNGANPVTGSEALAQNFDHYNTFTEYTFTQVLEHTNFQDIRIFPLNLYVFWTNPLNYALIAMSSLYTLLFRVSFIMYGKSNKLFTKKIGAVCRKGRG